VRAVASPTPVSSARALSAAQRASGQRRAERHPGRRCRVVPRAGRPVPAARDAERPPPGHDASRINAASRTDPEGAGSEFSPRYRRSSCTGRSRPRAPPTSRWAAARGGTRCGRSARPRRCTRTAVESSAAPWRVPPLAGAGRRAYRDGEASRAGTVLAGGEAGLRGGDGGRQDAVLGGGVVGGAVEYYRIAAEPGHPVGMCNLGVSYLEGTMDLAQWN
jgi:hypothetical protein